MHPYASKIALLIAVSLSQIVGGPSCCCLPRVLASALTISIQWNVRSQAFAENSSNKDTCPKCCRHRIESKSLTLVSNPVPSNKPTASVSSDGKCNCARQLSLCAPDERSIGQHKLAFQQPFCAASSIFDRPPNPTNVKTAYSPPIFHRPFGRSWQCLACIWIS